MSGCPGMRSFEFKREAQPEGGTRVSHLQQWPVQLHLVSPQAPYFQGSDLLISADCVAFSLGDFHKDHLKGKSLAIACPKLDAGQEIYLEKLIALIDEAKVNTITVMIMQVPCCGGLLHLVKTAAQQAERSVPIKCKVVSIQGDILSDEWV